MWNLRFLCHSTTLLTRVARLLVWTAAQVPAVQMKWLEGPLELRWGHLVIYGIFRIYIKTILLFLPAISSRLVATIPASGVKLYFIDGRWDTCLTWVNIEDMIDCWLVSM